MNDQPGQQNHAIAGFLLGWTMLPDAAQMRAARLGAFAYMALAADDPARQGFRADYLRSAARHRSIKAEVAPLLAAWRAAGIRALLWKGFHLAEFVYPAPGMRFHGDVDVLLHSADLRRAGRIAAELGWAGQRDPLGPPHPFRHNAYALVRPGGSTLLDVQRYVLHRHAPGTAWQRRLTRAVWGRSAEVDWEGTTVRLPAAVDAALVCLLLHRAWGSDRWGLKPHDLLDFRYLIEREGVTRAALESRAAELRCRRTLDLVLERCDPWAGRFEPGLPSSVHASRLDIRVLPEHVPFKFERWFGLALRAPGVLAYTLRALPVVMRVRRGARRQSDLHSLMAELTPPMPARRSRARHRRGLVKGIRWAMWLVREPRIGGCVIRSLALYRSLRERGWPVAFVSGVRHDENGWAGHAWVELDGQVLPELGEWQNPIRYRINFRYPTDGHRAPGASAGKRMDVAASS